MDGENLIASCRTPALDVSDKRTGNVGWVAFSESSDESLRGRCGNKGGATVRGFWVRL